MSIKHLIGSLSELYKKLFQEESIEINSMDFYLDELEKEANANRKRIADLGFWTEGGEYVEDYQEIDERDCYGD